MNFETELKRALARTEPPAGFAERVLARANVRSRKPLPRLWLAIAAAVVVAAIVPSAWIHYQQSVRESREREAGQQLGLALKIASEKLHATQQQIRRRTKGV